MTSSRLSIQRSESYCPGGCLKTLISKSPSDRFDRAQWGFQRVYTRGVWMVMKVPTRRDRWIYRWRCLTRWSYLRQTWLLGHGRLVEWWWNR